MDIKAVFVGLLFSLPFFLLSANTITWYGYPATPGMQIFYFCFGTVILTFLNSDNISRYRIRLKVQRDMRQSRRELQQQKREQERREKERLEDWGDFTLPTPAEYRARKLNPTVEHLTILPPRTQTEYICEGYQNLYPRLNLMEISAARAAYKTYEDFLLLDPVFVLPTDTRFSGTWIVAPPNRGKTNLLHYLVGQDRKSNATVVLMDSKGDLINSYRGMVDVVVIDPATANINPLQLGSSTRSVEFLEYVFSALLDTAMTALQKTLFRSVLTVLIEVPNATLETFRRILTVGWKPLDIEQYIRQCDPATQDFFLEGKPAEFDNATYRETKQQILWRLRLILSNKYLRDIFSSPTTNVPFSQLLDSGKTIIIDNSKDDLGEEGAEFFGRFFVALVWMAAVSRSRLRPADKVPVFFYIDEAHTVIRRDDKIATILDECRSQKIALILAHQRCAQIVSPNVLDALGNCAIRLANSDDDAAQLAPRFRVDPQALRLPIGQFACLVRDVTPQAVTLGVPLFDMSQFPPPPPKLPPRPHSSPPRPIVVPAVQVEDPKDFG